MDDLVIVKIFTSRWEADLAKHILESHGIQTMIKADDEGGMMPSLQMINGVQVLVRKKDKDKARELL